MALAADLRAALAAQSPCAEPEPAWFLGRDGARFTCQLGDGIGVWFLSSTRECFWSVMITKRGKPEEFDAHVTAMLARVRARSGQPTPRSNLCPP